MISYSVARIFSVLTAKKDPARYFQIKKFFFRKNPEFTDRSVNISFCSEVAQPASICSKSTKETPEQCVKCVSQFSM